jgi:two-component system chemotaxis response regulator CheB
MAGIRDIVIIGASTGGVRTIQDILDGLPVLQASIVVVLHMPRFINNSLSEVFGRCTEMEVRVAEEGDLLRDGVIHVAPGDVHLELVSNRRIHLHDGAKVHSVRPSIDVTMLSLVPCTRERLTGIVLTGMGLDGAEGIAHMKRLNARTIAQDEASSIVYGMPKAAYETGCIDLVLSPGEIRAQLIEWLAAKGP